MSEYQDRTNLITDKYLNNIKSASNLFMIYESGLEYYLSDAENTDAKNEVLSHYKDISDYTVDNLEENTIYKLDESGWFIETKDGLELKELLSGNTYNQSYLGILDINYRVFEDTENGTIIGFVKPHLGGDPRGNYGDGFIIIGDDEDEVFYQIISNFISGMSTINIEFNDGSTLTFDSQQEYDVFNYELVEENSNYENSQIAKDFIKDWESTDSNFNDSFLEETVNTVNSESREKGMYELGGSISDNLPRAYFVSLSDYNDGKSVGKWIEISDYSDGDEVMQEIYDFLDALDEKDDGNREEYAIHDYEGFGKEYYSPSMGEEDFDNILDGYQSLESAEFPIEVVEEYRSNNGTGSELYSDTLREMEDKSLWNGENREDYAYHLVEEGIFTPSAHNLSVTDTDIRIIAGEEGDNAVDGLSFEDAIDNAQMSRDYEFEKEEIAEQIVEKEDEARTLEEQLEDLQGDDYDLVSAEISDLEVQIEELNNSQDELLTEWGEKAIESIREEVSDDTADRLENDLEDYLRELGYENFTEINWVNVDYDSITDDLEQDHEFIESNDGTIYVFSNYYEGGGNVRNQEVSTDNDYANIDDSKNASKKNIRKFKKVAKKLGKKVGSGANKLGRGIKHQWEDADFGDGKGKAKFFSNGGETQYREETIRKYKEGTLFDEKGHLVINQEKMYQMIDLNGYKENPMKHSMERGGTLFDNPTYAEGGETHTMPNGEVMLNSDHFKGGGEIEYFIYSDDIKSKLSKMTNFDDVVVRGKLYGKGGEYFAIERDTFSGIVGYFSYDENTPSGLGSGSQGVKLKNKRLVFSKIVSPKSSQYAGGGETHTMPNGEVMLNSDHFKGGGEIKEFIVERENDKHYKKVGKAKYGIENDSSGKEFVTLFFDNGVNTYSMHEVQEKYAGGGQPHDLSTQKGRDAYVKASSKPIREIIKTKKDIKKKS